MVRDKLVDALHQLFDTGERAAANCLIGDQREDAFDLVQPGAVGLNEVRVATRPGQSTEAAPPCGTPCSRRTVGTMPSPNASF
jgi:hypothetical protein